MGIFPNFRGEKKIFELPPPSDWDDPTSIFVSPAGPIFNPPGLGSDSSQIARLSPELLVFSLPRSMFSPRVSDAAKKGSVYIILYIYIYAYFWLVYGCKFEASCPLTLLTCGKMYCLKENPQQKG